MTAAKMRRYTEALEVPGSNHHQPAHLSHLQPHPPTGQLLPFYGLCVKQRRRKEPAHILSASGTSQTVMQSQTAMPKCSNLLPRRWCYEMAASAAPECSIKTMEQQNTFVICCHTDVTGVSRALPFRTGEAPSPVWERHN